MAEAKPLVWLGGEIKTPPLSPEARIEAGTLLRRLQNGERLSLPHSRNVELANTEVHEVESPWMSRSASAWRRRAGRWVTPLTSSS
jgi:hypothetical protein